jgi:hypothetical protein
MRSPENPPRQIAKTLGMSLGTINADLVQNQTDSGEENVQNRTPSRRERIRFTS